jgi:hypothetical protein
MSRFKRLQAAGWKGVLNTIAVLLLTSGADAIKSNDFLVGGAMATLGFILFVLANYVG